MSNIGYSESATCIASVTKVLLGYHTGQLAGNLHCSQPREDVATLREGRLQVLRDHKPTKRSYIAVNGLSVTGVNSHVLLHGHYKPKDLSKYQCSMPRLVLLSSRTHLHSSVQNVIDYLKSRPIDAEELALIQNIHSSKVNGHLGRGFTILGHSVGELGCAYADGCLTAEEMILSAYSRGLVSVQTPFIRRSMAAVGIGFEEVSKMCPPEIEVACHNAADSSTISGPADIMAQFVAELTAKEIFAKEVPCSNIAYHSRYIAEAGPGLLNYLKEVIKTPKLRSERWVSTSVPQERWDEDIAKYSSAEYHTNNLLS